MINNIEDLFKKKLKNIEIQPDPELWNKIQKKYKRIKIIKNSVRIASVALFIIFVASLFIIKNNAASNHSLIKQAYNIKILVNKIPVSKVNSTTPDTNKPITNNKSQFHHKIKQQEHLPDTTPILTDNYNNTVNHINTQKNDTNTYKRKFSLKVEPTEGCAPLTVNITIEGNPTHLFIDNIPRALNNNLQITLDSAGRHIIKALNPWHSDSIIINVYPQAKADFMLPVKTIVNQPITFKNISQNANTFLWDFGDGAISQDKNPSHIFTKEGIYYITLIASSKFCSDTITKIVQISKKEQYLLFPNAIIPNPAGPTGGYYTQNNMRNDIFYPVVVKKPVAEYHLKIYDRNGNLMFSSDNIKIGWDGYYKGKMVPLGVYVYIVEGRFKDGEILLQKGDILVLSRNQ